MRCLPPGSGLSKVAAQEAGVAQLVERCPSTSDVAGSTPAARSTRFR